MENLLYNISQVLGITIIHSLWQGLLVYVVLRLLLLSNPSLSSMKKYNLAVLALLSMSAWFIYTFYAESMSYNWHPVKVTGTAPFFAALSLPVHVLTHADYKTTWYAIIKGYLPYVSVLYAVGLVINLGRLGLAWSRIRVIKQSMILAENLQEKIDDFTCRLKIRKRVQVSFSRLVDVPCVIGYFKPILLLPITLTFQLSTEEIETILLHELSHIKSNDYLLNMVQQIINVLLFFNPFAQLINRMISTERENRCDDEVVQATGNPLTYAYALLKLEEARQGNLRLALAATKNKHHLLTRIERIMKTKKPIGNIRPILLAVVLFAVGLSSIAWLNPEIKNAKVTLKNTARTTNVLPVQAVQLIADKKTVVLVQHKKISANYIDTTSHALFADTIKNKKAKIKIVVEDENGNRQEYNSVNDMPESVRNDFYKENEGSNYRMDDSGFRKMNKFYSSPQWKKQVQIMQNQALVMVRKSNSPAFKKQVEAMKREGEAMAKKFNTPEFKRQVEEMRKKGEEMAKYYDSPEWKKQTEDMARKGADMAKYYDSPEWKKQVEDMARKGADMAKYYDSPEWKKQVEDMARKGADMAKYYDSPEWKKMQADIVKQAEEIAKQYGSQDWNNDDTLQLDQHKKATGKRIYKSRKTEVRERPEKPEVKKAETKERPEKPEKPEKPESPEN